MKAGRRTETLHLDCQLLTTSAHPVPPMRLYQRQQLPPQKRERRALLKSRPRIGQTLRRWVSERRYPNRNRSCSARRSRSCGSVTGSRTRNPVSHAIWAWVDRRLGRARANTSARTASIRAIQRHSVRLLSSSRGKRELVASKRNHGRLLRYFISMTKRLGGSTFAQSI